MDNQKVTLQDIEQDIENEVRHTDEINLTTARLQAKEKEVSIDGQKDFFRLRKNWSLFLKYALGASILFSFVLTFLVGRECLNFENHQAFLLVVASENFAQIVGLATIAVYFFFNKEKFF